MAGNLDAYHEAQTRLEATERRVGTLVEEVKRRLGPLFENWRNCYPLTSPSDTVPALLTRVDQGGPVRTIDLAGLPDVWRQIQAAMAEYAEARQVAKAAIERLAPDEKARIRPPGMMTEPPRSDRVLLDPNRFRTRR